jgi:ubiquinone/menaquinone biosynthesis C-methylase UbiE
LVEYYSANKRRWNELVEIHAKSKEYDLENFIAGKNSLHRTELEILGNVKGKSLLHLQCHFGLDTISWARLEAKATGVDFSETAIELAREITKKVDVETEFVCCNVYDLPKVHDKKYDIVFTSYGVLCWLHDVDEWGRIIHHFLKPEGTFLLVESHPFMWVFDDESMIHRQRYNYGHSNEPLSWEDEGTYVNKNAKVKNKKRYEWQHTVSDVLNALIKSGLTIEEIGQYPELVWSYIPSSLKVDEEYFGIPGDPLPQTWSILASKSKH